MVTSRLGPSSVLCGESLSYQRSYANTARNARWAGHFGRVGAVLHKVRLQRPSRQVVLRGATSNNDRNTEAEGLGRVTAREGDEPVPQGAANEGGADADAGADAGAESAARLSTEEIQRQMGELRKSKEMEASEGGAEASLVAGVMEEVGLIQWPSFGTAFVNTLLVIAIVFGTSLVLFGVNTALTEVSGAIYSR